MITLNNNCSILGNWPNTYAFTKAMAEDLVKKESRGLPIGMFRPAIGKTFFLTIGFNNAFEIFSSSIVYHRKDKKDNKTRIFFHFGYQQDKS